MRIYVIRHGLTELNKKKKVNGEIDEPLALEGIEQAKNAVSNVPQSIKHIYSSSLLRAKETTNIINSMLKLPVTVSSSLSEIRMGSLAGYAWTEMKSGSELKLKHRTVKFDYRSHGGESVKDVKKRLLIFLNGLVGKYLDDEVLLVTHGGIIRCLYLFEHGVPLTDELGHIQFYSFDTDRIFKNARLKN